MLLNQEYDQELGHPLKALPACNTYGYFFINVFLSATLLSPTMCPRAMWRDCNKHEQGESRWYDVEERVKCGELIGKKLQQIQKRDTSSVQTNIKVSRMKTWASLRY